ncbi:hypothetical protein CsSME_00007264 [Camellia sinensis var. sinensis]
MDYQQQRRTMASSSSTPKPIIIISITISLLLSILVLSTASNPTDPPPQPPIPSPWPPQFHSILFINRSGSLQVVDLWYDWPNGRNFNIIQHQLAKLTYDLEWNNGTSFYYTLDSNRECKVVLFEVGILRPDWLDGANYLGRSYVDGFLCDGWEKADFIWYYQDVETKRPVHWVFHTGAKVHVMTFEVGKVLEDAKWQAPVYCFEAGKNSVIESMAALTTNLPPPLPDGGFMRGLWLINTTSFPALKL